MVDWQSPHGILGSDSKSAAILVGLSDGLREAQGRPKSFLILTIQRYLTRWLIVDG